MRLHIGKKFSVALRHEAVNRDHLAWHQCGNKCLEVGRAGMPRGVNAMFGDAVPLQPIFDGIVRAALPIALPLRVEIGGPCQTFPSLKVKPVQRTEKQRGFLWSLLQVLDENSV